MGRKKDGQRKKGERKSVKWRHAQGESKSEEMHRVSGGDVRGKGKR